MVSLFPSSFFSSSFFFFLNSVEQTTQQHIFHHQSFAEGNSSLLFHFFLMFTDRKANSLWRTGRADLSGGHSRRPAQHPWCTTAFPRRLAARGSAHISAFGCWVPNTAPQLTAADTGIWDTQRFAEVCDLHLGHLHKDNSHEQRLLAAGESRHQSPRAGPAN